MQFSRPEPNPAAERPAEPIQNFLHQNRLFSDWRHARANYTTFRLRKVDDRPHFLQILWLDLDGSI